MTAIVYGCGTYFAKQASYSANNTYSPPDANGVKCVFQARAITGVWCLGDSSMKQPPLKDHQKQDQYDSVVDNENNPTIFVVFNDTAAYPEYVVKFI